MKIHAIAVWLVFLFLLCGCARIPFIGRAPLEQQEAVSVETPGPEVELSRFVQKGRIVDAERLKQGKRVAVIPFRAGVDVAATDELDRIALNIIKGIADTFAQDDASPFSVVTANDTDGTDFIVEGHITEIGGPTRMSRWILLKGYKKLGVKGKVTVPGSGETLAVFADEITDQAKSHVELGYRIGVNLGQFLLSGAD